MAAVPLLSSFSPFRDNEQDDDEKPSETRSVAKPAVKYSVFWVALMCCSIGLAIGVTLGAGAATVYNRRNTTKSCLSHTSSASPVTRDIDVNYHIQQFEGHFMQENIYRQKGRPEVDEAWEALGINYRAVRVPSEVAPEVGLAADQVQINEKYGGGFPANVEGLHHLHCLNLLRKGLYYNFGYYKDLGEGAFQNEDHIVQKHISHCVDIIRQQLMCTVDIGVLGQVWYQPGGDDPYPKAFVDFNTKHVCRNYEDIRKWAEVRQLPEDVPDDYLAPPIPGAKIHDGIP